MIVLNNIQLESIIDKIMSVLKRVNGFDESIYAFDDEEYEDFLHKIQEDVVRLIMQEEKITLKITAKR